MKSLLPESTQVIPEYWGPNETMRIASPSQNRFEMHSIDRAFLYPLVRGVNACVLPAARAMSAIPGDEILVTRSDRAILAKGILIAKIAFDSVYALPVGMIDIMRWKNANYYRRQGALYPGFLSEYLKAYSVSPSSPCVWYAMVLS